MKKGEFAVLFVSHDRAFLRSLSTRILELDRGKLTSWTCGYEKFLIRKAEFLAAEEKNNAVFDKKLAEEEVWIRKGIQARRTRNEGRVRALFKLRNQRSERRELQGKVNLSSSNQAQASGRKVITIKDLNYSWGENSIIQNFTTTIWRGDKIGVVGLNGSGKSTLLQLLLQQLEPNSGSVDHGTKLEVAYFDQLKAKVREDLSVAENVAPNGDTVEINGNKKHILSYLRDFLFLPETARAPAKMLSGGERARLLLAKLFLQPANLLILDEPTNDLDIEMLEVLEEKLVEYQGTLIVVSHDRDFVDNVVTSTLVFEEENRLIEYQGGFSDWAARGRKLAVLEQRPGAATAAGAEEPDAESVVAATELVSKSAGKDTSKESSKASRKKLSYKLQRELDALPDTIAELEEKLAALTEQTSAADFYNQDFSETEPVLKALAETQQALDAATERWIELEEMQS